MRARHGRSAPPLATFGIRVRAATAGLCPPSRPPRIVCASQVPGAVGLRSCGYRWSTWWAAATRVAMDVATASQTMPGNGLQGRKAPRTALLVVACKGTPAFAPRTQCLAATTTIQTPHSRVARKARQLRRLHAPAAATATPATRSLLMMMFIASPAPTRSLPMSRRS